MITGRFIDATLRCAARGELPIDRALEQALPDRPDLWDHARDQLEKAAELLATRRGPEVGEANKILADLAHQAGAQLPPRREDTQ